MAEWFSIVPQDVPPFTLVHDGEDGWAFYIWPDDSTSYVHLRGEHPMHDEITIEWYGSEWSPEDVCCSCAETDCPNPEFARKAT